MLDLLTVPKVSQALFIIIIFLVSFSLLLRLGVFYCSLLKSATSFFYPLHLLLSFFFPLFIVIWCFSVPHLPFGSLYVTFFFFFFAETIFFTCFKCSYLLKHVYDGYFSRLFWDLCYFGIGMYFFLIQIEIFLVLCMSDFDRILDILAIMLWDSTCSLVRHSNILSIL